MAGIGDKMKQHLEEIKDRASEIPQEIYEVEKKMWDLHTEIESINSGKKIKETDIYNVVAKETITEGTGEDAKEKPRFSNEAKRQAEVTMRLTSDEGYKKLLETERKKNEEFAEEKRLFELKKREFRKLQMLIDIFKLDE